MRPKGQKCGNCIHFQVRNTAEADLARIARDESECAPGEWVFRGQRKVGCHGGAVKGICAKWRERKAPGPEILSTQWCKLWKGGGPSIRRAGSFNAPTAPPRRAPISDQAGPITLAVVAVLALLGWNKRRKK